MLNEQNSVLVNVAREIFDASWLHHGQDDEHDYYYIRSISCSVVHGEHPPGFMPGQRRISKAPERGALIHARRGI